MNDYIEFKDSWGQRVALGKNNSFVVFEITKNPIKLNDGTEMKNGCVIYVHSLPHICAVEFYPNVLNSLLSNGTMLSEVASIIDK